MGCRETRHTSARATHKVNGKKRRDTISMRVLQAVCRQYVCSPVQWNRFDFDPKTQFNVLFFFTLISHIVICRATCIIIDPRRYLVAHDSTANSMLSMFTVLIHWPRIEWDIVNWRQLLFISLIFHFDKSDVWRRHANRAAYTPHTWRSFMFLSFFFHSWDWTLFLFCDSTIVRRLESQYANFPILNWILSDFFSLSLSFRLQKMVLVLNGVLQDDCPMDTVSLFMQHPVYRDYANQLLSIPTKTVSFSIDFILGQTYQRTHLTPTIFFSIFFFHFLNAEKNSGWSDRSFVCWPTWNGSGGHTR